MNGLEYFLIIALLIVVFQPLCKGAESEVQLKKETPLNEEVSIEERWGIKILGIRLSANGYMVDFRYQVLESEKASPLFDRKVKATPYLIDEASGTKLSVPNMPKVGSLRAKGNLETDRNYFILFSNPNGLIKRGNKVTVIIGEFKAEHLIVQ